VKALLFQGCVIQNRIPFLEKSARLVFEKLGYNIQDAPFVCCPDPVGVAAISDEAWLILASRNLLYSEEENAVILSLCNGCSETLLRAKHLLKHDKKRLKKVNKILGKKGYKYRGKAEVTHFVRTLYEDIGVDKIKAIVDQTWDGKRNPFEHLRIGCHPGCHYNRPNDVLHWDDPANPKYQEAIIEAIGAVAVDYPEKTLCCGAGVARTREDVGLEMSKRKYESLSNATAQIICVNCPACYQTIEANQKKVNKEYKTAYDMPVLYITEIIALAFGYKPADLGLKFHSVGRKLIKSFSEMRTIL